MRTSEKLLLATCLIAIFVVITGVFASPLFMKWDNKKVARYYNENGLEATGSSNIVSAIVWDFRGFDTMGEETVLFTAAAGVLAITGLNFVRRKK